MNLNWRLVARPYRAGDIEPLLAMTRSDVGIRMTGEAAASPRLKGWG
jgi:hypothetical protein